MAVVMVEVIWPLAARRVIRGKGRDFDGGVEGRKVGEGLKVVERKRHPTAMAMAGTSSLWREDLDLWSQFYGPFNYLNRHFVTYLLSFNYN